MVWYHLVKWKDSHPSLSLFYIHNRHDLIYYRPNKGECLWQQDETDIIDIINYNWAVNGPCNCCQRKYRLPVRHKRVCLFYVKIKNKVGNFCKCCVKCFFQSILCSSLSMLFIYYKVVHKVREVCFFYTEILNVINITNILSKLKCYVYI